MCDYFNVQIGFILHLSQKTKLIFASLIDNGDYLTPKTHLNSMNIMNIPALSDYNLAVPQITRLLARALPSLLTNAFMRRL